MKQKIENKINLFFFKKKTLKKTSLGGGKVVSVLAFFSDDPSSNPAEVYRFYSVNCLKERI